MTETLANGDSSERTQRDLSNEYQHDRVWMVFKNLCVLVILDESSLSIKRVYSLSVFSESYTRVELCERQECLTGLGGRVKTLMELGCRLPLIKPQYLQEMVGTNRGPYR